MPTESPRRELADGKLLVDRPAERVVRLTISNPSKRNALDHPILDAISTTLGELESATSEARCVVLTGSHEMFSAGYAIGEITDGRFQEEAERLVAHPFTEAIDALEAFPYPTLAALPGHTIGGGLELALACDMRIAAAGIKLGMPPAKLGLVYSHTGIRKFIETIGAPRTRELFLLGRRVDALSPEARPDASVLRDRDLRFLREEAVLLELEERLLEERVEPRDVVLAPEGELPRFGRGERIRADDDVGQSEQRALVDLGEGRSRELEAHVSRVVDDLVRRHSFLHAPQRVYKITPFREPRRKL